MVAIFAETSPPSCQTGNRSRRGSLLVAHLGCSARLLLHSTAEVNRLPGWDMLVLLSDPVIVRTCPKVFSSSVRSRFNNPELLIRVIELGFCNTEIERLSFLRS